MAKDSVKGWETVKGSAMAWGKASVTDYRPGRPGLFPGPGRLDQA
jgi:hypothetical protein